MALTSVVVQVSMACTALYNDAPLSQANAASLLANLTQFVNSKTSGLGGQMLSVIGLVCPMMLRPLLLHDMCLCSRRRRPLGVRPATM